MGHPVTLLEQCILIKVLRFPPWAISAPLKAKLRDYKSLLQVTHLWSGGIKDISVLPGCCFLQVLPKAGTVRMKGSSSKSCGFQKRTLQCKDADAALNFLHRCKPRRKNNSLGSRVEKSDVTALQMPRCPRLAKEACDCTSPRILLVEGVGFQLHLRNVCLQGSLVMLQTSVLHRVA